MHITCKRIPSPRYSVLMHRSLHQWQLGFWKNKSREGSVWTVLFFTFLSCSCLSSGNPLSNKFHSGYFFRLLPPFLDKGRVSQPRTKNASNDIYSSSLQYSTWHDINRRYVLPSHTSSMVYIQIALAVSNASKNRLEGLIFCQDR